jgi:hypothetical protein
MNGTVLDILIYVFDRYMFDESPEVPAREALAADPRPLARAWVPARMGGAEFVSAFMTWAEKYGVKAGLLSSRESRRDEVFELDLKFRLEGDPAGLSALFERRTELPRLAQWITPGPAGGKTETELGLKIFSVRCAPSCIPKRRDSCGDNTRAWLWPYTQWLSDEKAQRDRLCAEIWDHREVNSLLCLLKSRRRELERVLAVVEEVEGETGRQRRQAELEALAQALREELP